MEEHEFGRLCGVGLMAGVVGALAEAVIHAGLNFNIYALVVGFVIFCIGAITYYGNRGD